MRIRPTGDVATLARLIDALAPYDGSVDLRGAGVHAMRLSHTNDEPVHYVQPSSLCIVAQEAKVVMIGEDTYAYEAGQMAPVFDRRADGGTRDEVAASAT